MKYTEEGASVVSALAARNTAPTQADLVPAGAAGTTPLDMKLAEYALLDLFEGVLLAGESVIAAEWHARGSAAAHAAIAATEVENATRFNAVPPPPGVKV